MSWDVFVSHASEDNETIARPLAQALREQRLRVWFDEFELKVGKSLLGSIDRGLAECDFGVVILSPSFFAKRWPRHELAGLVAREGTEPKIILPVWHNISATEIAFHSPVLADRKATLSSEGIEHVVSELLEVIRPSRVASSRRMGLGSSSEWENPLAPLTLANIVAYAQTKDSDLDWSYHSPSHYTLYRRLHIVTMAQLVEAIEDQFARETLDGIYRRLLMRDTDWAGVFAYQPAIFFLERLGQAFVEQQVLASREYWEKRAASDQELGT